MNNINLFYKSSQSKFYNYYWRKNNKKNPFGSPPVWNNKGLSLHYQFFKEYIGEKILDIGCGDGTFINYIGRKQNSKELIGVDISNKALQLGRRKYKNIKFINSDLEKLKFKKNTFDTVFAVEVIEHLLNINKCFSEINRVLKKNGYFCITTTEFNLLKKILIAIFFWEKFFHPQSPHIRFFTKKSLQKTAKRYRFKMVAYKWNGDYWSIMPKGQMAVFQKMS